MAACWEVVGGHHHDGRGNPCQSLRQDKVLHSPSSRLPGHIKEMDRIKQICRTIGLSSNRLRLELGI